MGGRVEWSLHHEKKEKHLDRKIKRLFWELDSLFWHSYQASVLAFLSLSGMFSRWLFQHQFTLYNAAESSQEAAKIVMGVSTRGNYYDKKKFHLLLLTGLVLTGQARAIIFLNALIAMAQQADQFKR